MRIALSSSLKRPGVVILVASVLLALITVLWAANGWAQGGVVRGRVVDGQGRPVAGAEIGAFYRSYGGGQKLYGGSYNRQAVTGADGRYSISLAGLPPGEYLASGSFQSIDLVPENSNTFASNAQTVRNFSYRLVESSEDNSYGNGAILAVNNDIMDFTDLAGLELTVRSRETGQVYTKTVRRTGEGYAITGLPFGSFDVSARLHGRQMQIKPHNNASAPFAASTVLSVRKNDSTRVMYATIKP